ncbi:phosphatase PAP2 family protein [Rhodococcus sp. 3Y1]
MAAAFFLVDRRLGLVTTAAAVIMGFSRVYVGAHYPHDVAVGLLVGAVVGTVTVIAVSRYGTTLVKRLSQGPVRPLLTSLSAAMKFCPETATKLPAGGHETCPVAVMGSARHDVVCLTGSDG